MRGAFLGIALGLAVVVIGVAYAAPTSYDPRVSANMTRPCSYQDQTSTTLSITSTSARTSSAMTNGVVRMVCSTAVHYRTGVAGPTAITGDALLPANTIEWFVSEGAGNYVAAIRDAADGTCYLTVCR